MKSEILLKIMCMVLATGLLSALMPSEACAYEERNYVSSAYSAALSENGGESLVKTGGDWFPYPSCSDREGWARLFGADASRIIGQGRLSIP